MNTTQRMLPYARQYVIVAIYEVLDRVTTDIKKQMRQQSFPRYRYTETKVSFRFP